MKELKKGDFTGIYSSIDEKPLYFTGVYSCMEYDGMPCVFLATDIHNNLTFCRWSQQDLNKRGFTIPPEPVRISKTAMQMIQKAGAVIRWTTAAERKAANTDHKRRSPYILTAANGGEWYTTGTCADVREILKAANAEPLPEESMPATETNQDTTTGAQDGHTAPESNTTGENTTGADKAPEGATSDATTAETATEGTETSTATQDTTGSDTRPPRAQEANQEPGHAAGDHSGQAADHITGAAAEAITGRTTTPPQNPGHACEIAPGRTERAQAEQVHTAHTKSPPRGTGSRPEDQPPSGNQRKTAIPDYTDFFQNDFRKFSTPTHFGIGFWCQNRPEYFGAKMDYPRGYQNLLQIPEQKNFFQKMKGRYTIWDATQLHSFQIRISKTLSFTCVTVTSIME